MTYAIAAGGLIGTFLLAYALLSDRSVFGWRRWAVGGIGFALAAALWIVQPQVSDAPIDGSSLADQWP